MGMDNGYFHQPLGDYTFQLEPTFGAGVAGDPLYDGLVGGNGGLWDRYLASRSAKEPFKKTWDEFIEQWRFYPKPDTGINATPPLPQTVETDALAAFTSEFEALLETNTDWADLNLTASEIEAVVKGSFGYFLRTFPYDQIGPDSGGGPITSVQFFEKWKEFMTVTTVILSASATGARENVRSFQDVFEAFFPSGADFETKLREFFDAHLHQKGYFLPSHHIDEWVRQVTSLASRTKEIRLTGDELRRRNIMLLVFKILRQVLERLQETVSIQATRLGFLADYQARYTDLMARVPIYQALPPKIVGPQELWEAAVDDGTSTAGNVPDELEDDLINQVGANGTIDQILDQKGFAGITLREIREAGIPVPTQFGYSASEQDTVDLLVDAGQLPESARIPDSQVVGKGLDPNEAQVDEQVILNALLLNGENPPIWPGVWWLVDQPLDGTDFTDARYGDLDDQQQRRTDINQHRQQWIEGLRSKRNIVKDQAKQGQTNMSQTQEAINQQSNLMTSIIQQMSGIIQGIFR